MHCVATKNFVRFCSDFMAKPSYPLIRKILEREDGEGAGISFFNQIECKILSSRKFRRYSGSACRCRFR